MTLKDKIHYGYLTFKEFSDLIDSNVKTAAYLNIRMWWEQKGKGIVARMKDGDTMIYENVFTGQHLHFMMAKMHYNCSLILDKKMQAIKKEDYRQRMLEQEALAGQNHEFIDRDPDADKLTMGEMAALQRQRTG